MYKIDILGTTYTIEQKKISECKELKDNNWAGYCCEDSRRIVVADLNEEEYFDFANEQEKIVYLKKTLRHEIMHAFLNESGLRESSLEFSGSWARNEEMVDWLAIQFPKIYAVYKKLNILD